MGNKDTFAFNLRRYMELYGKSRNDISEALGISYFTVSDWVNGKKYPRMDKVEMLANYFGILKSDLIEDKTEENPPEEPMKLNEGERMLLELFRRVPEDKQELVLKMIALALDTPRQ
jgi:transcriptional regulator with XRE-family HTH domain